MRGRSVGGGEGEGGRKGSHAAVQALPPRTFLWGQQAIRRVLEYKHLVITITPDGWQDTHFKHVITQENASVQHMLRRLQDKHLTVHVKCSLL